MICFRKSGGLIRRFRIADFNSWLRFISFVGLPIRDSLSLVSIASTASYATLLWRRIIWSSWNSSSNFSSVRGLVKKLRFVFGFSTCLTSFSLIGSLIFFFDLSFFGAFSIGAFSSFFETQFFSFSFSLPNMVL